MCQSDKDGKIIIYNYNDYINIVNRELSNYEQRIFEEKKVNKELKKIKQEAETMIKDLYYNDAINEELLYQSTGLIKTKTGRIMKMPGPEAKYFDNFDLGYVYVLVKTHKMKPEQLVSCNVHDIPVRLVQAAGQTYLGRITAMLEHLLAPISVSYCKDLVNEYCKDSKSYTEYVRIWSQTNCKSNSPSKNYYIATSDVKSLYPNVPRNLIQLALEDAIETCSFYSDTDRKIITNLCMLCLKNSYIKFDDKYLGKIPA